MKGKLNAYSEDADKFVSVSQTLTMSIDVSSGGMSCYSLHYHKDGMNRQEVDMTAKNTTTTVPLHVDYNTKEKVLMGFKFLESLTWWMKKDKTKVLVYNKIREISKGKAGNSAVLLLKNCDFLLLLHNSHLATVRNHNVNI